MKNVSLLNNPVLEYRPDSSVPVNIAAVAERISGVLGRMINNTPDTNTGTYYVPFAAVHEPLAHEVGISGEGDLYGGIVKEPQHADKAILHLLPETDTEHPSWYSTRFARNLSNVTLPGFTTFSAKDTFAAFNKMTEAGLTVRFKDPSNTGGLGQRFIGNHEELDKAIQDHGDKITEAGAVLEVDLTDHATVTVGYVNLAGQTYTWHGRPYDVQHNGMTRFGGNELTVVKGNFKQLEKHSPNPHDRLAIRQAERVYEAYSFLGATVTRATLDAVQGTAHTGEFLSGITDPSLRPSASSAAEIRAIEAFHAHPNAQVVKTRLVYDYAKDMQHSVDSPQELFVSHPRMNIFTELVEIA